MNLVPISQKIYDVAKACLGKNLCGPIPIEYGCAQTVNTIVEAATGQAVGGGASTYLLYRCLISNPGRCVLVASPVPGDIIISPSGFSSKGHEHGHVGIVGKYGVLANNSSTGKLEEVYTLETWADFFGDLEGFPVYYFHFL